MNRSALGARLLVGALVALLLGATVLLLRGPRAETTFSFPVDEELRYELELRERDGRNFHGLFIIQDQDGRDLDRRPGQYRVRVVNPAGLDLAYELRVLRDAPSNGRLVKLPPTLPRGPFVGAVESEDQRVWAPLGHLAGRLQGERADASARGRAVDLSGVARATPFGNGCGVARVAVSGDGESVALARSSGREIVLEIWRKGADRIFREVGRRGPFALPVDPVWDGDSLWLLEVVEHGRLLRWRPLEGLSSAAGPVERVRVPGARCLLAAGRAVGGFWFCGGEGGRFLFLAEGALPGGAGRVEALPFESHPSLSHLPSYLPTHDAFLLLEPALDREESELVLRDRRGRWARPVRTLSDRVAAVAASDDLETLVGIERCQESR